MVDYTSNSVWVVADSHYFGLGFPWDNVASKSGITTAVGGVIRYNATGAALCSAALYVGAVTTPCSQVMAISLSAFGAPIVGLYPQVACDDSATGSGPPQYNTYDTNCDFINQYNAPTGIQVTSFNILMPAQSIGYDGNAYLAAVGSTNTFPTGAGSSPTCSDPTTCRLKRVQTKHLRSRFCVPERIYKLCAVPTRVNMPGLSPNPTEP